MFILFIVNLIKYNMQEQLPDENAKIRYLVNDVDNYEIFKEIVYDIV